MREAKAAALEHAHPCLERLSEVGARIIAEHILQERARRLSGGGHDEQDLACALVEALEAFLEQVADVIRDRKRLAALQVAPGAHRFACDLEREQRIAAGDVVQFAQRRLADALSKRLPQQFLERALVERAKPKFVE